ncbi:MAG: addiction module antidote protein, HigA family [Bacteroidetes bacterium]|nr:MAG: addiction module antidote protein, HigA family [Bacteroidota bacterium]
MGKQKIKNEGGVIGTGAGLVNQNSKEFKALRQLIETRSKEQGGEDFVVNQLLSLRFQMETYIAKEHPGELIQAGEFLEGFVKALKIRKKDFAEYIGYKESNLSAILKGRRKINSDLALKFGEIFSVNPEVWLNIQNKNELLEMIDKDKEKYERYKLEDLLKQAN